MILCIALQSSAEQWQCHSVPATMPPCPSLCCLQMDEGETYMYLVAVVLIND
jgi:hypothetical protein